MADARAASSSTTSQKAPDLARSVALLAAVHAQVMFTLELLAEVFAIDPQRAAAVEFERVQAIPKQDWERRHGAKVKLGIALGNATDRENPNG